MQRRSSPGATIFAAGLIMLAGAAAPAHAQQRGPSGPQGRGGPPPGERPAHDQLDPETIAEVASELGIDNKVLEQIRALSYGANRDAIGIRADLQRAQLDLQQWMHESRPDAKKVLPQVDVVGALETKLRKNHVQLALSVGELLTVEQREKLRKIMAARRGPPRGGHPGMDGGSPEVRP